MAGPALEAANNLAERGVSAQVLLFVCAKPIDHQTLKTSVARTRRVLFIEEALCEGGFGHSALPFLIKAVPGVVFDCLGVKDHPLCQGSRDQLLALNRLQPESIAEAAMQLCADRH